MAIPTVREFGARLNVPLIRINPTNAQVNCLDDVALQMGALESITLIAKRLVEIGFIEKKRLSRSHERPAHAKAYNLSLRRAP